VPAENHLAATLARLLDHLADVTKLGLEAPLGGERSVRCGDPVVVEAEVVGGRRIGVAGLEATGVLERRLAPIDRPGLQPVDLAAEIAGNR
jgi:hypothetical protein